MRDPDAPAVLHFVGDEFLFQEFDTLAEAIVFLLTRVPSKQRPGAWIATTWPKIEMEEIIELAASLGIEWDVNF